MHDRNVACLSVWRGSRYAGPWGGAGGRTKLQGQALHRKRQPRATAARGEFDVDAIIVFHDGSPLARADRGFPLHGPVRAFKILYAVQVIDASNRMGFGKTDGGP